MLYVLTVLLSMHSLIEGVALGVGTTINDTLGLLLAICAHKWFEAFALGVRLAIQKVKEGHPP